MPDLEDARRDVCYTAARFAEAEREGFPLRVVRKRYRAVYEAMYRAKLAGVPFDWVNATIRAQRT